MEMRLWCRLRSRREKLLHDDRHNSVRLCQNARHMSNQSLTGPALGVGVVGAGFMGDVHSRAARAAGGRLISLTASTPESSKAAALRFGFESAAGDLEQLLSNPDIDVVHVCTPNSTHAEIVRAAIEAGKHVVCEKPLATTLADASDLRRLAVPPIRAAVPFVYRYHPLVREARWRVTTGEAGTPVSILGIYLQDWLVTPSDDNWRVDPEAGGASRAFADIGSHLVDLIEFVTDDRIERINAVKRTVVPSRVENESVSTEDLVAAVFTTTAGVAGTLLVSQVAPGRKNRLAIEISGTDETIGFDQEQPETLWLGRRSGTQELPRDSEQLSPDATRLCHLPAGHPLGYQDAFNSFVADAYAAISGEEPEGLPTFADGERAVAVTEAVMRSAATGEWVVIEEVEG